MHHLHRIIAAGALAAGACAPPPAPAEAVELAVHGGQVVLEGDILLGPLESLAQEHALQPKSVGLANLSHGDRSGVESLVYAARLWPKGIIPYRFAPDVTPLGQRWVEAAIDIYHRRTSLRWVRRDDPGPRSNHVVFTNQNGLGGTPMSFIGDWKLTYKQHIWLGGELDDAEPCPDPTRGAVCPRERALETIVHEMGHAVGLWHEQQHRERDRHNGSWTSLSGGGLLAEISEQTNFAIADTSYALTELDWESIMLYRGVFAPAPGLVNPYAGAGHVLSEGDVRGIELMYGRPLEPVAEALRVDGQLHVFAKLENGDVIHTRRAGQRWQPSESWESQQDWTGVRYFKGAPEAVVLGDGRLALFVRGPEDQLLARIFDPQTETWQGDGWTQLHLFDEDTAWWLRVRSHPEVVAVAGATVAVHFLDGHQRLRTFGCGHEEEGGWECAEARLAPAAPAARSLALDEGVMPVLVDQAGRPRVLESDAWRETCRADDAPFSGVAGRLAVVGDTQQGPLDLLARDPDGHLLRCARRDGAWGTWQRVALDAGSPPTAARDADGVLRYWLRGPKGRLLRGSCSATGCSAATPQGGGAIYGAPLAIPAEEGASSGEPELLVRDAHNRLQLRGAGTPEVLADGARVRW